MAGTASLFNVDAGREHSVRHCAGRPGAEGEIGRHAGQGRSCLGDFVGGETCATCHDEIGKEFADNPHTKMALMHGSNGVTCENCHGAGKAHVDGGGDTTKIFNPAKASSQGSGCASA